MTTQADTAQDLTVADVAHELQIHPDTVREMLVSGVIVGYKPGKRSWRVTRADLDAYKDARRGGAK